MGLLSVSTCPDSPICTKSNYYTLQQIEDSAVKRRGIQMQGHSLLIVAVGVDASGICSIYSSTDYVLSTYLVPEAGVKGGA